MKKHYPSIKSLLQLVNSLEKYKIIKSINSTSFFHDDPHFFLYSATLNTTKRSPNHSFNSYGFSLQSPEHALLKCLSEAIERYSLVSSKQPIHKNSFNHSSTLTLNPLLYSQSKSIQSKKISWVDGFNLGNNKHTLLPAQLVYIHYPREKNEFRLDIQPISTGAAAGTTREQCLLNGIYEVIERDSLMNMYLAKIPSPSIDLKSYKNSSILHAVNMAKRYRLSLNVFSITTDLSIPSIVTILCDKTGIGPSISIGAKANLNIEKAIVGSLEEAFMVRQLIRTGVYSKIYNNNIEDLSSRVAYWYNPLMLTKLKFWLSSSQKATSFPLLKFSHNQEEIAYLVNLLKQKGYDTFYADLTNSTIKTFGYLVYKVIIPGLQPLYSDEQYKKYVNKYRLNQVARFFSLKAVVMNNYPHPFL